MSSKYRVQGGLVDAAGDGNALDTPLLRAEALGLDVAGEIGPLSLGLGHGAVDEVYPAEAFDQRPAVAGPGGGDDLEAPTERVVLLLGVMAGVGAVDAL